VTKERTAAFAALRELLAPYAGRLTASADDARTYMLDGEHSAALKRPMFFGGVRQGENYVSYYLMPVYTYPELLSPISDALRKRMHGKGCFNFTKPDPELFAELAALTRAGFARFAREGHVT
jgi:hypothetical protein